MTKILFKYIINNYLQTIFKVILIFYCFGLILNLFEEIEFFKELGTSVIMPLTLTALFVPNLIIKLLPFVIFISSMWFLLNLRNSKNLLDLKVFGYSLVPPNALSKKEPLRSSTDFSNPSATRLRFCSPNSVSSLKESYELIEAKTVTRF